VEGTVDLAYSEGDAFVLVDFKTDQPDGARLERYRRQVAWYAAGLRRATGKDVRGIVMAI
jgi:ATP-dependent exoDNAse (exonuclease V) beta subunit